MGSGDQGIRGTVGTEDQLNSGDGRPEEQWTRGPEDQRTRGPEEQWAQWAQRTRETVCTEEQQNSWHKGPVEKWAQRTNETVGTED